MNAFAERPSDGFLVGKSDLHFVCAATHEGSREDSRIRLDLQMIPVFRYPASNFAANVHNFFVALMNLARKQVVLGFDDNPT